MSSVIEAWHNAAFTALHPSREVSEDAYWASGRQQAADIARALKPGSTVVDVGCGDGRVAVALRDLGFTVVGADSSERMLAALSENSPGIETVVTDGTDLAERLGGPVDAVICLAMLIHHDYETGRRIVEGLSQAVKPGGVLILDWPTSDAPVQRGTWIEVTTWPVERQREVARGSGIRRVRSSLPWSVFRVRNDAAEHRR